MTHLLPFVPAVPTQAPTALTTLHETVDEAIAALSTFDADRLDAVQERIGELAPATLARDLAEDRDELSELLRKHTLLGEMLNATAANLRVVAAVLEAKRTAIRTGNHDRSNLVSWPR